MATNLSALDQYVEQHLQENLQELMRLCNQPSVSAQGLGIRECANLLAQMLEAHGVTAQVMETAGHPVVFGECGTGSRALLLYNHYDVQPPEPLELWESPPFEATIRDGKLFARGAADDKGEIASRLAALDAFRAVYGELPYRLKFLIEGEEEIGSPHLHAFIRDHRDLLAADACLWEGATVDYEGRLSMYLGLRGITSVELRVRTMNYDVHSGEQSYLPNAAWRLVWALSKLKDEQERILIPGFYDNVRPPSAKQRELLAAMPSIEADEKRANGVSRFAGGLTGQAWKEAVFLPTCTINGLGSGYQGRGSMTIIPARAMCKIDFRLVPEQDPEEVLRKLRAHLDAQGFEDIEIIPEHGERAGIVDPDHPFVQLTLETAREVYGKEPAVIPLNGGSGPYASFLEYLHVPITALGIGYLECLGHAPNEHIRISDWLPGTMHAARLFERFREGW